MDSIQAIQSARPPVVPVPHVPIAVRVATMGDLPFLDELQKQFGRALGYFPTKQFEGYIEMGAVLVAWATRPCESDETSNTGGSPVPLGYIISRDRYLKRDELGVVYQLCVKPGDQRKLVGATLVREVFNRSAYGCKLYCCWCAQDLPANHFWESMGFVPIAFRAGGRGRAGACPERAAASRRVHIFWQRRINQDDVTTPYWYPSMTNQGAIREDRLVFPIPPGTHWTEVAAVAIAAGEKPKLPGSRKRKGTPEIGAKGGPQAPTPRPRAGVQFGPPPPTKTVAAVVSPAEARPVAQAKPTRPKKEKIDPALVAKARELRDRYLEHVNTQALAGSALAGSGGRYQIGRVTHPAGRVPLPLAG